MNSLSLLPFFIFNDVIMNKMFNVTQLNALNFPRLIFALYRKVTLFNLKYLLPFISPNILVTSVLQYESVYDPYLSIASL